MNLKDIRELECIVDWITKMASNDLSDAKTELLMSSVDSLHITEAIDILDNAIFKILHVIELNEIILGRIEECIESAVDGECSEGGAKDEKNNWLD